MLEFEVFAASGHALDQLLYTRSVLRMYTLEHQVQGWSLHALAFEHHA